MNREIAAAQALLQQLRGALQAIDPIVKRGGTASVAVGNDAAIADLLTRTAAHVDALDTRISALEAAIAPLIQAVEHLSRGVAQLEADQETGNEEE